MRKAKASVLAIILWILVILAMLAVSIGHRVSMALRISAYHKDRLKAYYLAKAGLNLAITEIINDKTAGYDSLVDSWANNEDVFKKIIFNNNPDEFSTVSYDTFDSNNELRINYGAIDEERKVNINTASKELLIVLLEKSGVDAAEEIADNILIWRGDIADDNKIYESSSYTAKAGKFSNIEELNLVKGMTGKDYQILKGLVTAYGDGFININTASFEVLTIFARGIAKELGLGQDFADTIAGKINALRDSSGQFKTKGEINIPVTGDEETAVFNKLMDNIVIHSDNFLIESVGNVRKIKSKIIIIYSRKGNKNLYWHEN